MHVGLPPVGQVCARGRHRITTANVTVLTAMADEFDSWLNSTSKPKPAAAPAPAASGWGFSASSFLGGTGLDASSLLGGAGATSLLSAVDTLRSQAKDAADSLKDTLQTQAPVVASGLTSVTSVAGAVAGQLQQTVESQMSQFADEQARFCTADAKKAELQQYKDVVHTMGQTIGTGDAAELEEHGGSLWGDAPEPLRAAFEEAIRKLAQAETSFLSEAQLPPAKRDPSDAATEAELQALLKMARGALVRDEGLRQMRFKLVPTRVKEAPFWRHYMLRVLRERRLFGLPVLKPPADDAAPGSGAPPATGGAPHAAQPPSTAAADEFQTVDLLQQAEAEADALLLAASTPSARSADATLHAATASLGDTFASAAAAATAVTTPSLTAHASSTATAPHRSDNEPPTPATSQRSGAPSHLSSPPTSAPDAGGTPATIAYSGGAGTAPRAAPPSAAVPDAVAPATPASSTASATPATAMAPAVATTPSAAAAAATVVAAAANVAAAAAAAEAALATPTATPTPAAATTPVPTPVPATVSPAPAPAEALTADELEARIARELELGDGEEDGDSGELIDADEDFDNVLGDL